MIATNAAKCTGCRMCELACSFHHRGIFSPELSSIRVLINNRTGEVKIYIDNTCNLCKKCIESCPFGALTELR